MFRQLKTLLAMAEDARVARFAVPKAIWEGVRGAASEADLASLEAKYKGLTMTDNGDHFLFTRNATSDAIEASQQMADNTLDMNMSLWLQPDEHVNGIVPGATTKLASDMNDSAMVAPLVQPTMMESVNQADEEFKTMLHARIQGNRFDSGPSHLSWHDKEMQNKILQLVSNPKQAFGQLAKDLVTEPTANLFEEHLFGKNAKEIYSGIIKPLKGKDVEVYNDLMRLGNDEGVVFQVRNGTLVGLDEAGNVRVQPRIVSPQVAKATMQSRMFLDHLHNVLNTAAARQARNNGFKLITESFGEGTVTSLAKPSSSKYGEILGGVEWNKARDEAGFKVWEVINKEGASRKRLVSPAEQNAILSDLPDTHQMVGYRYGYVPIIYKDSFAISKVVQKADGTFEVARVATADSRRAAMKAAQKLELDAASSGGDETINYIAHRKHNDNLDIAYSETLGTSLGQMSPGDIKSLREALTRVGINADELDRFIETLDTVTHKKNPYMMHRGDYRLRAGASGEPAPMLPADEAINKYISSVAGYQAHAAHTAKLEDAFIEHYGRFLHEPNRGINSSVKLTEKIDGHTGVEAQLVKEQIKRTAGLSGDVDNYIRSSLEHAADAFQDWATARLNSPLGKTLGLPTFFDALDSVTAKWGLQKTAFEIAGMAKGFTTAAKLGLWNVSQVLVQGSALLNVVGYRPLDVVPAILDMMNAVGKGKILKIGRNSEGMRLWKLLDDSGFVAGFDFVEADKMASAATMRMKFFGIPGTDSILLRKLAQSHMIPYKVGEGGVRALAWFAERRALLREIANGAVDLEPDSLQFLREVNRRAQVPALNMSRMNQPMLTRGFLGIPMQFKQFVIHQAEFMGLFGKTDHLPAGSFSRFGRTLSLAAPWAAVFGIQGLPFVFDMAIGLEKAVAATTNDPEYVGELRNKLFDAILWAKGNGASPEEIKFWQRMVEEGPPSALSEGMVDIANRASLARFFTEYYGQTGVDDLMGGAAYQTMVTTMKYGIKSAEELFYKIKYDENISKEWASEVAKRMSKGFPGLYNFAQAGDIALTGNWSDAENRLIKTQPSLAETLFLAAGLKPAERAERYRRIEFLNKQQDAWNEWMKDRTNLIADLAVNNPAYSQEILDRSLKEIGRVNPMLTKPFFQRLGFQYLARSAPENSREMMSNLAKYSGYFTFGEIMSLPEDNK